MFFGVSRRSVLRSTQLWKIHEKSKIYINNSYLRTIRIRNCSTWQQNKEEFIEEENEPPEPGKRLFRDGIIIGLIAMMGAWSWTLYKQKRDNYDNNTLIEVYSIKAHIEHAFNTKDIDLRTYHLSEAEIHCRKALSESEAHSNDDYDPQIIAVHIQLGKICYLLHKYQPSIDSYLIVLKALTQEFGYKSHELIMPCRQISDCYMNLGQYQMSLLFLERVLKIINNNDNDNNEHAPIYQQMAVLFRKQYKWNESIEYTNKAIKGAKSLLGENHIQIVDMLLGRACCEMELKQWGNAEITARNALKIIEYETNQHSSSVNKYNIINNDRHNKIIDGGIKNTLKNKLKNNLIGVENTEQQIKYEQELQLKQQKQQMNINYTVPGIYLVEQLIEMKCSILYVIGQSLIEQNRLNEAQIIFNNALKYAIDLNDNTKQLLIYDQLRDIQSLSSTNDK